MAVSGLPWSAAWPLVPLVDMADVNPESLSASTASDFRFRYIDLGSVERGRINWPSVHELRFARAPSRARRLVRPGDVLFGTVRPTLQSHGAIPVVWSDGNLVASTGFSVIRARRDAADERFLFHFILSSAATSQARRVEVGSNYPAVNEADVRRFQLPKPPVAEQRRIAEILDTVDEAQRKTEQLIAKLQQMKQGLLHDLLTRGIDDSGELRDPQLHPEEFRNTRLGRLPREWRIDSLSGVANFVTSGSRGWGRYYSESGPVFVRIGNLTRSHINLRLEDVIHVRPPIGGEGNRTRLENGDLLISITADLGIVGVVPDCLEEAYVNQHIALIRVDPEAANSRWLGHFMAGRAGQTEIRRHDDRGAKAGLNLPTVLGLPVALPQRTEQDEIARKLDGADAAIAAAVSYLHKLRLLRRGLMEDLLTGRVRVTDPAGGGAA